MIEERLSKYTRYYGAETVGSSSSLYVLKTTPATRTDDKVLQSKIYTFENTDTDNFPYVDHYVFKLQKVTKEILTSKNKMQKLIGDFCKRHKLNVKDVNVAKFKGQGFSFTYIFSTSNLVVHTWPESNSLHFDLITCAPIYNKELLANSLVELFGTEFIEVIRVE